MTEGDLAIGSLYYLKEFGPDHKYRKIGITVTMALNPDGSDYKPEGIHPFDEVVIINES